MPIGRFNRISCAWRESRRMSGAPRQPYRSPPIAVIRASFMFSSLSTRAKYAGKPGSGRAYFNPLDEDGLPEFDDPRSADRFTLWRGNAGLPPAWEGRMTSRLCAGGERIRRPEAASGYLKLSATALTCGWTQDPLRARDSGSNAG